MIICTHDASTDKTTIERLSWKPCPFCSGEELTIYATPSYVGIGCRNLEACGFNFHVQGKVETINGKWNSRETSN